MDARLIVRETGTRTERSVSDGEWPALLEDLFGVRDALI
jgi:hypothetical protein